VRHDTRSESGFTLIEILASMAVGVVLIYLLTETLAATQTAWVRANQFGRVVEQETRTAMILNHTLANMLPPTPDGREHTLIAKNQSLEFFALPPQARAEGGVMRGRLAIEPVSGGLFALVLNLVPADGSRTIPEHAPPRVLLTGLASASFSYYYAGPDAMSLLS
jgi:prepilin-type N-terminal cleavage/methylation domain-containing protein